jgi:RecA-family ATPase
LATIRPQAKHFAIERLAPLAEVTLFTGPGSAGKSLLGQQLATCAAAGLSCLGLAVIPGPAIYLTCEDDADQLHWRQAHICDALGVPMATLAGKLNLISLRGGLDNALTIDAAERGKPVPSPSYARLVQTIEASGAKLAILDNLAHLFTGNENDRGDVTRFVNLLNRLAGTTGAAILLLGHPPKPGRPNDVAHDYSGSTAWLNAVRSQFKIDHERDGEGTLAEMPPIMSVPARPSFVAISVPPRRLSMRATTSISNSAAMAAPHITAKVGDERDHAHDSSSVRSTKCRD